MGLLWGGLGWGWGFSLGQAVSLPAPPPFQSPPQGALQDVLGARKRSLGWVGLGGKKGWGVSPRGFGGERGQLPHPHYYLPPSLSFTGRLKLVTLCLGPFPTPTLGQHEVRESDSWLQYLAGYMTLASHSVSLRIHFFT